MDITSQMVKALRDKTGLPMMECKQALIEAQADEAKAIEILRKKGLGQLSKRAGRETTEGRIACFLDAAAGRGGIVELLCETAPVANTGDFINLAFQIARHAAYLDSATPDQVLDEPFRDDAARRVRDLLHDAVNRMRENIRVARVGSLSGYLGHYVHHNGQVGVLVELSADCPTELKADVCMHIAAMRPSWVRREEVDPQVVEMERRIAAEQVKDKPEHMIARIVDGKLNRWYSETVLLEQPFVKQDKKTVGQVLLEAVPGLTVRRFLRFEVGGS